MFLHSADIQEPEPKYLWEGHRVSFEIEESERGPRAVAVKVITGTERLVEDPVAAAVAEFDEDDEDDVDDVEPEAEEAVDEDDEDFEDDED